MTPTIAIAETDDAIQRCFPVIRELRPHLPPIAFVEKVRRQHRDGGYQLAYLETDGLVRSVAGFRLLEGLKWGKYLYVDDLVTRETDRSHGHGRLLLEWLVARARELGCDEFHLDSGTHRTRAHQFYRAQKLDLTCYHFALKLR
ncbi:MAG: GNAT family N-acetyltransferase [Verrucomicrobia bacterium]|nr:GNAT family N-acetyltransferase [Verrucomicrobiota bacterium]